MALTRIWLWRILVTLWFAGALVGNAGDGISLAYLFGMVLMIGIIYYVGLRILTRGNGKRDLPDREDTGIEQAE